MVKRDRQDVFMYHLCTKTRTANVLNCFKNDLTSSLAKSFSKNTLCKSRKSKLKFM